MPLKVREQFLDNVTYAVKPNYERKDGNKFVLKECDQKDLRYLYEVVGMKDVIYEEKDSTSKI